MIFKVIFSHLLRLINKVFISFVSFIYFIVFLFFPFNSICFA